MAAIMLTKEQRLLLELLKEDKYITASELAQRADCSSKTIRTRIKDMNETLEQLYGSAAAVESKPRFGFRLVLEPGVRRDELCKPSGAGGGEHVPATPGERADFLLFHLLDRCGYVTISELADMLYVSQGVVKTALKNTENILARYGIHITRRPGYGILAAGEETNIRTCLVDMYMDRRGHYLENENALKNSERLSQIVLELMEKGRISLQETAYHNFIKYIFISVRRIRQGREVDFKRETQVQIDSSNMEFIECLSEKLEVLYAIDIPPNEKEYLAIQLAGKRVIGNNEEGNLVFHEDLNGLVSQMMDITYEEFKLDLRSNLDLIMLLNQHMIPLDIRLRYNIPLVNPMLEDIQKNYPFACTIAERASVILKEYYGKEIPQGEIGYLAVIYALGLEKQKPVTLPGNILIVCSSGKGSSRLLAFKYRQEFGAYVKDIKICNLFELGQINFEEIDYVFTTVPIHQPVPVPVYEVSLFLSSEDIVYVRSILEKGNKGFLKDYFAKELFFTGIGAQNKEQVIHELCQKAHKVLNLHRDFEESVLYREELSTTDYGNMTAIPHPYKPMTETTKVIVGILEKPVYWGRSHVQAVFLISIGKQEDTNIQRFYQSITQLLTDKSCVQSLICNHSLETFLNHL